MTRMLLACILLAVTAVDARAQTSMVPVVVTQGEAAIKRAPDRAWLTIATETRDSNAAAARRLSAESMTSLQASLRGVGLATDAIRTTGYSLAPDMEWKNGRGIVRGYIVRNQIEVRIDDLDRLSEVIDTANTARGTTLSIVGPRFGLKDEAAVQAEALRTAVASAMSRAQAMAAGAGRSLGAITRIEEHNLGSPAPPQPMMMRMAAAEAAPTPIEPGEIEIRALVTLTVQLQ